MQCNPLANFFIIFVKEIFNYTVEADAHESHVDFIIYDGIGYIEAYQEAVKLGIDPDNRDHLPEPMMKGYVKKIDFMANGLGNLHQGSSSSYMLKFEGDNMRGIISGRERQ